MKLLGNRVRRGRQRPRFRPCVEGLEDRTVPSVSYHGGPLLTNVHVATFYYGSAWGTDSNLIALRNRIDTYVSFLVNGPYMDMLSEYYQTGPSFDPPHVGRGQFVGDYYGYWTGGGSTGIPRNSHGQAQDQDIKNLLLNGINSSPGSSFHLPSLKNFQNLWLVFLPPGVAEDEAVNDSAYAYHGSFFNPNGAPDSAVTYTIQYGVFPYPGGVNPMVRNLPNPFDNLTGFLSHEVAEAVTDPNGIWDNTAGLNPGGGWWDSSNPKDGEIGDIANLWYALWQGYVIQGEWSNAANRIVYPAGATPLNAGSNYGGAVRAEQISDVTGGPFAGPLTYTAVSGTSLVVGAGNGVLTGASDGFGNPLTASLWGSPSYGSVTLNPDGSFTYVPAPGFTGTDTFSYQVTDGAFVSDPATVTINVHALIPSGIAVTSSAASVVSGQLVTFTAFVSGPGSVTPTGNVTFYDGSTPLGTVGLSYSSAGTASASFSSSTLSVGSHTITAAYEGDSTFQGSTSIALTQVVTPALLGTATYLHSSAASVTAGQSVTFTGDVAGAGSGNPPGTVTFYDGSTPLGTVTLGYSSPGMNSASFSTSTLGIGSHTITVVYGGDSTFQGSTSTGLTQLVTALLPSGIAVASSAASIVSGQVVTLTAYVSGPGSVTPTGNVTFFDSSTALGTVGLSYTSAGTASASFSSSTLSVGSHTITAVYSGDSTFQRSTATATTVSVTTIPTVVTPTPSATAVTVGQPLVLTAVVAPANAAGGVPTGSVTFADGGGAIATVGLDPNGAATLPWMVLSAGAHTFTAVYHPTGAFTASSSPAVAVTATPAPTQITTSVTLTPSATVLPVGQTLTLTAAVIPASPVGRTPTGSVTFADGGVVLATVDLDANGAAATGPLTLSAGAHALTASYNPTGIFLPSFTPGTSPAVVVRVTHLKEAIGVFDGTTATWYLRGSSGGGAPDAGQFNYGAPGWIALVGDWTGSGQSGIGVYDPSTATWYLRNEASAGGPDAGQFQFGAPGWIPIVGDWTGSGHMGIGVYDPSTATFYLRNEATSGAPDAGQFAYGVAGWLPLVGDWSGSGKDGIGVFDPSTATFYLRNEATSGAPDAGQFAYGLPGWLPIVADWSGSGKDGIGVFDPTTATWYLRNEPTGGAPDLGPFAYGGPGWQPLAGVFTSASGAATPAAHTAGLSSAELMLADVFQADHPNTEALDQLFAAGA